VEDLNKGQVSRKIWQFTERETGKANNAQKLRIFKTTNRYLSHIEKYTKNKTTGQAERVLLHGWARQCTPVIFEPWIHWWMDAQFVHSK
jgi:hypothetical protein